ncbi:hypothetical protein P7C71_g3572, partial [Lecanoromycetidae sp. Uapishka_2]
MDKGKRPARPIGKLHLTDLPVETQSNIVRYVNRKDLLSIQCVNSHFHALASAVIYRKLDLTLTNSGDEENGLPTSHAADALQTILASEHDYGQHIKAFRIGVAEDIVDLGSSLSSSLRQDPLLMTRLLWDSKSDSSKFLNTALLLLARKASILETFQLDVTPSPKMVIRHGNTPGSHPPPPPAGLPPPAFVQPPAGIPSAGLLGNPSSSYPGQTAMKINNIKRKKAGGGGGGSYWANGRAFSGFRTLTSLTLMGLSNLECLSEFAECIKASSATLKCLNLSLSMDLARKARKPSPVNPDVDDPSDTELDEEDLLNDPMPPTTSTAQPQPVTNEADIRKEKLAQESILARVFDLQSVAAEGKKIEQSLIVPAMLAQIEDSQAIARKADAMRTALLNNPFASDKDTCSNAARLDQLKMIRETADLYITQHAAQKKLAKDQPKAQGSSAKNTGSTSKPSKPLNPIISGFKPVGSSSGPGSNLIDWDLSTVSSPTSPFPYPDFSPKDFIPASNSSISLPAWTKHKPPQPYEELALLSEGDPLLKKDPAEQKGKEHQAQSQPYSSPYTSSFYPYLSSGSQEAILKKSQYESQQDLYDYTKYPVPNIHSPSEVPNLNFPATGSGTSHWPGDEAMVNAAKLGLSKMAKETKQSPLTKTSEIDPVGTGDVSEGLAVPGGESDLTCQNPYLSQQPFFAADMASGSAEEPMDVDMDHPDEEMAELGEDQEFVAVSDDSEVSAPRKRAKVARKELLDPQIVETNGSSSSAPAEPPKAVKVVDPDVVMQTWIRANHGLQLEELSLEWVPLKGSIVARALDLRVLKRITFLEVGPQDAFWTLLSRLQTSSWDISFKSIHTDNVSHPFVKFLATFEGLEELYMHERNDKKEPDPADVTPVTIRDIRKSALKRHIPTLRRLMIRNDKNEKWDVDHKTVDFLAKEGKELTELAFSLSLKTYHRLMQKFAGFTNLYALHLINLRSTSSNPILQQESLSFAVDSLTLIDSLTNHHDMKIKYIAMANHVIALEEKPDQFSKHLRMVIERRKDKKGKGKALAALLAMSGEDDDSGSDVNEVMADVMAGERRLKFPTNFAAVDDVKIFSKEIRGGTL